jgi:hypothetical protein
MNAIDLGSRGSQYLRNDFSNINVVQQIYYDIPNDQFYLLKPIISLSVALLHAFSSPFSSTNTVFHLFNHS